MTAAIASRAFALVACAILVAPAAFMAYAPPAHAIPAEVTSDTSVTSLSQLAKQAFSAVKNAITSVASVTSAAKETALVIEKYVLQPLAYITSGNLLKKITSSILGFVGGRNSLGKPLYIQDLRGYIGNTGDVEAYTFLNQYQSNSNSIFAGAITSSLRAGYLSGSNLTGFLAANRSTLGNYSSNPSGYVAGNWSQGGWAAWFGLTTQDQNNPYTDYFLVSDQLERQRQTAEAAKLAQANQNQGFLSWCGANGGAPAATTYDANGKPITTVSPNSSSVSCPTDTVNAGNVCGCQDPAGCFDSSTGNFYDYQTYVLPNGYSCPSGSSFDTSYGSCQTQDGIFTDPIGSNGNTLTDNLTNSTPGGTSGPGGVSSSISCPQQTVHSGSICGCDSDVQCYDSATHTAYDPHTFVLPSGDSCPSGTTFDTLLGGCKYITDGAFTAPLDSSGNPITPGSTAAQDFNNSGDAYNGTPAPIMTASNVKITTQDTKDLRDLLTEASKVLPNGYSVIITSAERNTNVAGGGGISQHALGDAIDFEIVDSNGHVIPNRGADTTGWYQKIAVAAYQSLDTPSDLRWGGCFDTGVGSGTADLMHIDFGGASGLPQGHRCPGGLAGLAGGTSLAPQSKQVAVSSVRYTGQVLGDASISTAPGGAPTAGIAYPNGVDVFGGGTVQPGDPCTKADGTQGIIQTPGSIIKEYLSNALKATGLDKLVSGAGDISTQLGSIFGDVSTVFNVVNEATGLFSGNSNGLLGFSGNGAYNSPFANYLSDPGYLGFTNSNIYNNPTTQTATASDLPQRVADYQTAWQTIGTEATAAAAALNDIINNCSANASAAQTALNSLVTPVLQDYANVQADIATANALIAQTAADAQSSSDQNAYTNDLSIENAEPPSPADVANAQAEAQSTGAASAVPTGSLNVQGGTIYDRMQLLITNAGAFACH